ncbi:unnamed protein product [Sphagnum troendelagicum]|uniref:Uncharacterized protein n=1 Tax=Sphagnum troendelagicum TaxID=128251 RepID=A0ABP0TRG6_9BRYO
MHMIQSVKQPTEETSFFPHFDCDSSIKIAATVTGLGPLICKDVNFDSSIRTMRRDVELTSMHRQVGMENLEFQRTYHLCTTSVLILSSEAVEDPFEALHHFVSLDWMPISLAQPVNQRPTAMSVLERGWLLPYFRATRRQNELLITMMLPLETAIGVAI